MVSLWKAIAFRRLGGVKWSYDIVDKSGEDVRPGDEPACFRLSRLQCQRMLLYKTLVNDRRFEATPNIADSRKASPWRQMRSKNPYNYIVDWDTDCYS